MFASTAWTKTPRLKPMLAIHVLAKIADGTNDDDDGDDDEDNDYDDEDVVDNACGDVDGGGGVVADDGDGDSGHGQEEDLHKLLRAMLVPGSPDCTNARHRCSCQDPRSHQW